MTQRLLVNVATNQDTLLACCYSLTFTNNYMNGEYAPHYPMPVIPLQCEWRSERQTHYRTLLFIKRAYTDKIHAVAAWWQS